MWQHVMTMIILLLVQVMVTAVGTQCFDVTDYVDGVYATDDGTDEEVMMK